MTVTGIRPTAVTVSDGRDCATVAALEAQGGVRRPVEWFGASDCVRFRSHRLTVEGALV